MYFCTGVPTESFEFGSPLIMKMKPTPLLSNDVAARDDYDEDEALSCSIQCFVDNLTVVKSNPKHDAWNFFLAAYTKTVTTQEGSNYDSGAEGFDLNTFVRAMLEWMYRGNISGLTRKWAQELFQNINTDIQLQEFKKRLLEEAQKISYGDNYRKKGVDLRIKVGKGLVMKRLKKFIEKLVAVLTPSPANL